MVARSGNPDRTVQDTPANSEILDDRTVEVNAANDLLQLSRVGDESGGGNREKRVFRCKTCMKDFSSSQALGGHRSASHRKPVKKSRDEKSSSLSSESVVTTNKTKNTSKKTASHICPICGIDFPMGQALGGHMKKHSNERESGELVTRSFFPETTTSTVTTTLQEPSSGKRVLSTDLGSDSVESMINLNLELGSGKNE
ncbi:hypothetical protein EUTSA_v10002947mg [Eutrema salsugineum]|uniref:C2H2-type domain-containing protein n=1 Tax=Eutrema salsugineum TaxID=72664 RepID=V4MY15_EUTSA|nr:zinc finger protein ZAT8 [Eutrema salsugineum]ESQ37406.1 hypothetical protein EUTSA_v10002947mg [Eutrema salsugineum]